MNIFSKIFKFNKVEEHIEVEEPVKVEEPKITIHNSCNCHNDYIYDKNYSNENVIKNVARTLRSFYTKNSTLASVIKFVVDSVKNVNYIDDDGYELIFDEILIREYILCGNLFFLHKKNKSNKKIDTVYVSMIDVMIHYNDKGFFSHYEYFGYCYSINGTFLRREPYANPDIPIDTSYRLCHIKNDTEYNRYWGLTDLTAIIDELEILESGIKHNQSLLKNGASPSGILAMGSHLSQEQMLEIKKNTKKITQGENNSGKIMFLGGVDDISYTQLSKTNKDMDYANLIEMFITSILNLFKISPSILGRSNHDTHNNSDVGYSNFWNYCCFPLLNKFELDFNKKSGYLFSKFKKNPKKFPVEALKTMIDIVNKGQESQCLTVNELREHFGLESLIGGDIVRSKTTGQPTAFKEKENLSKDVILTDWLKVKNDNSKKKQDI